MAPCYQDGGRLWSERQWEPTEARAKYVRAMRQEIERRVNQAKAAGEAPDGGRLLGRARRMLAKQGIPAPSFDALSRLPVKLPTEVVDLIKFLALCPLKGEGAWDTHPHSSVSLVPRNPAASITDARWSVCVVSWHTEKDLEGETDSGEGLDAACESQGMCMCKCKQQAAGLHWQVVWRNLRETCVRKKDVSIACVRGEERIRKEGVGRSSRPLIHPSTHRQADCDACLTCTHRTAGASW